MLHIVEYVRIQLLVMLHAVGIHLGNQAAVHHIRKPLRQSIEFRCLHYRYVSRIEIGLRGEIVHETVGDGGPAAPIGEHGGYNLPVWESLGHNLARRGHYVIGRTAQIVQSLDRSHETDIQHHKIEMQTGQSSGQIARIHPRAAVGSYVPCGGFVA